MRNETVARNYAGALFELAQRHEGLEAYGEGMSLVARLVGDNPEFRLFLETPRIAAEEKKRVLRHAFAEALPRHLLHFLLLTVDKRRQRLLGDIAREFEALRDEHAGRTHVQVTVARPLDEEMTGRLTEALSRLTGKTAVPHVRVDPAVLGGAVIQAGDTIYDGSLRRRLERLRRSLLAAELPAASGE